MAQRLNQPLNTGDTHVAWLMQNGQF